MKMRSLEKYCIPLILLISGKNIITLFLLPIQEEAVRYYGVLDYAAKAFKAKYLIIDYGVYFFKNCLFCVVKFLESFLFGLGLKR